ncbi:MAG: hypothetical protein KHZ58_06820 [Hungatella hathewayi]|nr:hypothetical protein [Hungatella hathewayi]
MELEQRLADAERENARLKADDEMLLDIIAQMKITLNRLIDRYMTDDNPKSA